MPSSDLVAISSLRAGMKKWPEPTAGRQMVTVSTRALAYFGSPLLVLHLT
jgi:hypothetical protein